MRCEIAVVVLSHQIRGGGGLNFTAILSGAGACTHLAKRLLVAQRGLCAVLPKFWDEPTQPSRRGSLHGDGLGRSADRARPPHALLGTPQLPSARTGQCASDIATGGGDTIMAALDAHDESVHLRLCVSDVVDLSAMLKGQPRPPQSTRSWRMRRATNLVHAASRVTARA